MTEVLLGLILLVLASLLSLKTYELFNLTLFEQFTKASRFLLKALFWTAIGIGVVAGIITALLDVRRSWSEGWIRWLIDKYPSEWQRFVYLSVGIVFLFAAAVALGVMAGIWKLIEERFHLEGRRIELFKKVTRLQQTELWKKTARILRVTIFVVVVLFVLCLILWFLFSR